MNRKLVLAVAAAAAAGTIASPAFSAPKKKPITKTYSATAPTPDPTNWLDEIGMDRYSVCNQVVPQSFHTETFKAPAAGSLKVELTGFLGDWDVLIMNSKKAEVGAGGDGARSTPTAPTKETATIKIKKAETFSIVACNWSGGPTGTVKYTFTYK